MYRSGHLGISLVLFAPIGYLFATEGEPLAAVITGGVMLWLATLPDVDQRISGMPHRGPTHSLLFAVLVGGAVSSGADQLSDGLEVLQRAGGQEFWFFVGVAGVCAHLVGDLLTPAGVNLLWPWNRQFSLQVTRADSTIANYGLLLLGVLALGVVGTMVVQGGQL